MFDSFAPKEKPQLDNKDEATRIFNEITESLPTRLEPKMKVSSTPNEDIEIYKGDFELFCDNISIAVKGSILFHWLPEMSVMFSGNCPEINALIESFINGRNIKIRRKEIEWESDCFFTEVTSKEGFCKGTIKNPLIVGDQTIATDRIEFHIPNLKSIKGKAVMSEDSIIANTRTTLDDGAYTITLDKVDDYNNRIKELKAIGGYSFLYNGILVRSDKQNMAHSEYNKVLNSLTNMLHFVNGRRCAPLLRVGLLDSNVIQTDFSTYHIDTFRVTKTWLPDFSKGDGLSDLWKSILEIGWDTADNFYLEYALHWYVEANSHSGFTEGAIVFIQNALELLFNWIVVEKLNAVSKKQAKTTYKSASDKIRFMLSHMNVAHSVPAHFHDLAECQSTLKCKDAPEIITRIRNAFVHSQDSKREDLEKINGRARWQALQLSIEYVELFLLKFLGYNGEYKSRTSNAEWNGDDEMKLPWSLTE